MINFHDTPIHFQNIAKYKLITALNAIDNKGRKIFTTTIESNDGQFQTILADSQNKIVGTNKFNIVDKTFYCKSMDAYSNGEHVGLGEIMHLASIINLLENKLKNIQLYSLNDAIPFHLKYKFKPQMFTEKSMFTILTRIASVEENSLEEFAKKAVEMFIDMDMNGSINKNHNYYKELPEFIISYINKIKNEKLNWNNNKKPTNINFKDDLYMDLNDKDIIDNTDFFNNLFAKHQIDYKI